MQDNSNDVYVDVHWSTTDGAFFNSARRTKYYSYKSNPAKQVTVPYIIFSYQNGNRNLMNRENTTYFGQSSLR